MIWHGEKEKESKEGGLEPSHWDKDRLRKNRIAMAYVYSWKKD